MEWTKVSDGLPKIGYRGFTRVLVTCLNPYDLTERSVVDALYELDEDGNERFGIWDNYYQETLELKGVIAWMPWPEPYYEN